MMRLTSWWRELSGSARFRLYSQLTLQGVIVVMVAATAAGIAHVPWAAAGIVISGVASLVAVQAQPDLSVADNSAIRRWALPAGVSVLVVVWLASAVSADLATDGLDVDALRTTGIITTLLGALSVLPFVRHRWWIVVAVSIASGAAFGSSPAAMARLAAVIALISVALVVSTLLTLWGLHVVDELERAKAVEARLQVAEERLRFARDLHDVVGRGFSAIAVKSELAATLSRAGAAERAATEMDEVKALAVESMDQMRELVRGYRDINLDGEVAGARSLLAAAGCALTIEGDPAKVPGQFHEVAAWVVREGTTNIVKHSSATSATITLGDAGISLRNNGVPGQTRIPRDPLQQTGLRGLAERLTHVGAILEPTASGDSFLLEVHWEKS